MYPYETQDKSANYSVNPIIDFFVVGAQKSGTTALYHKLCATQQVFNSPQKELHFFDNERIDWSAPNYAPLERSLRGATDGQLIGDATPIYMYWPNSMERISHYHPNAKIIVILRHPIYRAISHWKMEIERSREYLPFRDAIRLIGRARLAQTGGIHRGYSYVERGLYAPQVERILNLFDRRNVFFCTTDALYTHETSVMNAVLETIGGKPSYNPTKQKTVNVADDRYVFEPDRMDIEYLSEIFSEDIAMTAKLTGLSLLEWQHSDYQEAFKYS